MTTIWTKWLQYIPRAWNTTKLLKEREIYTHRHKKAFQTFKYKKQIWEEKIHTVQRHLQNDEKY